MKRWVSVIWLENSARRDTSQLGIEDPGIALLRLARVERLVGDWSCLPEGLETCKICQKRTPGQLERDSLPRDGRLCSEVNSPDILDHQFPFNAIYIWILRSGGRTCERTCRRWSVSELDLKRAHPDRIAEAAGITGSQQN
jgi:hypothetical protein